MGGAVCQVPPVTGASPFLCDPPVACGGCSERESTSPPAEGPRAQHPPTALTCTDRPPAGAGQLRLLSVVPACTVAATSRSAGPRAPRTPGRSLCRDHPVTPAAHTALTLSRLLCPSDTCRCPVASLPSGPLLTAVRPECDRDTTCTPGICVAAGAAPRARSPWGFCFEVTDKSSQCPEQQGPAWPSPRGCWCDGGIPVGASAAHHA